MEVIAEQRRVPGRAHELEHRVRAYEKDRDHGERQGLERTVERTCRSPRRRKVCSRPE